MCCCLDCTQHANAKHTLLFKITQSLKCFYEGEIQDTPALIYILQISILDPSLPAGIL